MPMLTDNRTGSSKYDRWRTGVVLTWPVPYVPPRPTPQPVGWRQWLGLVLRIARAWRRWAKEHKHK